MKILLVGGTGLVGGHVLQRLLADARVDEVVAPSRRPLAVAAKLHNPVIDFERLPEDAPWWAVDAMICTLGTTIRVAGSQAAFRRVDLEYPLRTAALARRHGARACALNSAMGANAASRIFYNRVKGEVEAGLEALGFASLTLVRPGMIEGERDHVRPAEAVTVRVLRALAPVLPRRYRVNPADRIAAALVEAAIAARPGRHVVPSEALVG